MSVIIYISNYEQENYNIFLNDYPIEKYHNLYSNLPRNTDTNKELAA
jgi:hypothetical protein